MTFPKTAATAARWVAPLAAAVGWGVAARSMGPGLPDEYRPVAVGPVAYLLAVATVTDLRRHKIYNWATYPTFLWALAVNAAGDVGGGGADSAGWGLVGLPASVVGGLACFFGMLVPYSLSGNRGAGDVKLAAALGAWLGPADGLAVCLYTFAVAGVGVVAWLVVAEGPVAVGGYVVRLLGSLVAPGVVSRPPADRIPQLRRPVPMAAFFAAGTVLAVSGVLR